MEISYIVIENTLEKGKIMVVILKMKLMMISTYLIFMIQQLNLITTNQIIYVMKLKKQM